MTEFLETPLIVVHVLACLFLILVVLLQPGKGGGLGGITSPAAQQVFGGRGAGNFLTRTTWVIGTTFFVTSLSLAYLSTSQDTSLMKSNSKKTTVSDSLGRGHLPTAPVGKPK